MIDNSTRPSFPFNLNADVLISDGITAAVENNNRACKKAKVVKTEELLPVVPKPPPANSTRSLAPLMNSQPSSTSESPENSGTSTNGNNLDGNNSDSSDSTGTLGLTDDRPYISVPPVDTGLACLYYNNCDISGNGVEVWSNTDHPVHPREVKVLSGKLLRPERSFSPVMNVVGHNVEMLHKHILQDAKRENPTTLEKRLFLCSYMTTASAATINQMYDAAMEAEHSIETILLTSNGKPTNLHGKPIWVIIDLCDYIPHPLLPLPHAHSRRISTCVLFDATFKPILRSDSKTSYDKYPEHSVTISVVDEHRNFDSRTFYTNIDPGVQGIMIMPHYADPEYGPVNQPDCLPGALYRPIFTHLSRLEPQNMGKGVSNRNYKINGLYVMYVGPYTPLLGIVGVVEDFRNNNCVVIVIECVEPKRDQRLLCNMWELKVIYDEGPQKEKLDIGARRKY